MSKGSVFCAAAILLVLAAGCSRPRLTSRPLTEEEREWATIIRTSYPAWKPPYYSPAVPPQAAVPPAAWPAAARPAAWPAATGPVAAPALPLPPPAPRFEAQPVEADGGEIELVPVDSQR